MYLWHLNLHNILYNYLMPFVLKSDCSIFKKNITLCAVQKLVNVLLEYNNVLAA